MKRVIALGALALMATPASAIFVNGGFEAGNFGSWNKTIGSNPGLTGAPPFTGTNIVIGAGGQDLTAVVGAGSDPRAPHLVLPRAGAFTARVNDFNGGANLNAIRQAAPITNADRDATDGLLHVRFSYAAVLEDPGHSPAQQPYFFVRLRNLTKNTTLYEDFTFSNQPGKTFIRTGAWLATNFINVDIVVPDANLNDNLEIEAFGVDCSPGAHGGYVYLDGFGSAIVPPGPGPAPLGPQDIPTLSEWGLIVLALLLGGAAFVVRRNGRIG
jgi:hypothetical protein